VAQKPIHKISLLKNKGIMINNFMDVNEEIKQALNDMQDKLGDQFVTLGANAPANVQKVLGDLFGAMGVEIQNAIAKL
jgi:hypothetical protein